MVVCCERGCKLQARVRDDDTFRLYCWDHRKGSRHFDCGCEADLVTFLPVEWCDDHWVQQQDIYYMVKGRWPYKKPTKSELQARIKKQMKSPKWKGRLNGSYY